MFLDFVELNFFFLFKSYLYKQDNIVSVENSFRIV